MSFIRTVILLFFCCNYLFGQTDNEQIEFRVDNDQFLLMDQYYTNGIFLTYKRILKNSFLFFNKDGYKSQFELSVGQQMYTPSKIKRTEISDLDRPYAGWLFAKLRFGGVRNKSAIFIGVETGITGEESLAQDFQNWIHTTFNVGKRATWVEQIAYKWLLDLEVNYFATILAGKKYSLVFENLSKIGSKDIFTQNGINFYFGRFNDLKNSSRIGVVDNHRSDELFGFISIGHRFVEHNTLIEGSLNENDVLFTEEAVKHIFKPKFGIVYKYKRTTLRLFYSLNTKEIDTNTFHGFGSVSYSINF